LISKKKRKGGTKVKLLRREGSKKRLCLEKRPKVLKEMTTPL